MPTWYSALDGSRSKRTLQGINKPCAQGAHNDLEKGMALWILAPLPCFHHQCVSALHHTWNPRRRLLPGMCLCCEPPGYFCCTCNACSCRAQVLAESQAIIGFKMSRLVWSPPSMIFPRQEQTEDPQSIKVGAFFTVPSRPFLRHCPLAYRLYHCVQRCVRVMCIVQ